MKKQTPPEQSQQSQPAQPLPSSQNLEAQAQKIEALAGDAATVDADRQLFTPEKKKRGPRGPYNKNKNASPGGESQSTQAAGSTQAPPPSIPSSEIVRPTVETINAWTQRITKNPKTGMFPEEKEGICKSLGLVLDKWAPVFVHEHAAEIMAVMAISAWGTRVYAIVSEDQKMRRAEYDAKVKAQQSIQSDNAAASPENRDPNPSGNGRDPHPVGPRFSNPFAGLPQ